MKQIDLDSTYEPCCAQCRNGIPSVDKKTVFCKKRGVMEADDCCRKYDYDPLRRVPKGRVTIPVPEEEEFRL